VKSSEWAYPTVEEVCADLCLCLTGGRPGSGYIAGDAKVLWVRSTSTRWWIRSALLRRGAAMPSWHGPGSYANQRHDICYQKRSKVAACEGTPRIARVSFPHGLASEAQLRSASFVGSRCYAINDRGSQFI